jgi:hypothetical protein
VRPALAPPGMDALSYFYEAGKKKGIGHAIRTTKRP